MIEKVMKYLFFFIIFFSNLFLSNELRLVEHYLHVNFKESSDVFINPYMGYAPWASSMTTDLLSESEVSLAFALIYWKDFEPQKGFYDFDAFENSNNFESLSANNIKIIIRVICDYPASEKHIDIPGWLYDEMGGAGVYYDNNGLAGFVPDYGDPYFMERHSLMIKALSERYDNSPDIAFIQLGSLGHWGEWHNIAAPDAPFPDTDITDIYVEHYLTAFTQKKLQMRRPYDVTRENKLGLYNDMTGHEEATSLWLGWINDYNMSEFYIHSPSGGEFASTYSMEDYFGKMYPFVKQMIIDSHMTYIGNLPPDSENLKENIDDLLKTIGYRFTIRDVLYTSEISSVENAYINLCIENTGIAPFYYQWPFYYMFYDQYGNLAESFELTLDVREILPENCYMYDVKVPVSLPPGDYMIKLGLFNPDTNTADVRFANLEVGDDRLFMIGTIKVTE